MILNGQKLLHGHFLYAITGICIEFCLLELLYVRSWGSRGDPKVTLTECSSMQRNLVRKFLFVVTPLLLIATSLLTMRIVARADQNSRSVLSGHAVPLIQQANLMQATDANQQMNLSIGLQLRNSPDLDSLLSQIYDPQSPQYHQYLTPDQFNQLFAPTADEVQQVVSFLQSQDF